jgi:hypothetical protein
VVVVEAAGLRFNMCFPGTRKRLSVQLCTVDNNLAARTRPAGQFQSKVCTRNIHRSTDCHWHRL